MKKISLVFIIFLTSSILCTGCNNEKQVEKTVKEKSNLQDSERVEIVNSSEVIFNNNIKELSNTECDSKTKKVNYTLKIVSDKLILINEDTFENYSVKNISNVKEISSITYTSKCEDNVYILLTENGDIYYTDNDIVNFKDVKNIDKEFKKLSSEYKFADIKVEDEVYSITNSGEILKLNFR